MQIHKMKLHAHQSLLFTLLLALYLCPSLTFSLHQLSRQTEPLPFLNAQVLTDLTEETESSDGDYYQLVAFVDYLRDYNFSSGWMNSDTSDDDNTDSAAGLTFHMCTPNPSGGTQIMALYCYLLIGSMTSNSSYSQSFVFDLEEANYTLSSINSELGFLTVPTNVTLHNDTQPATNQICMGNLTYSFINSGTNQPYNYNYDSMSDLSLQISFQGLNCSVQISTSLLTVDRSGGPEPQVIAYIAPMAVIALLQIFCCYKLMRNFNSSANIAKRASVGTISFFITFDFYVFLMNFEYWTILPNLMLVVVVLFGLLALIIQPVTVYFVFKGVRRTNDLNLIMSLFFKLALWLLVTLASAIVSLTYVPNVICYVYPFFLLPQIMDNIFINRKHKWNIWFIIMGFSNLLYIGYVAFDPLHLFNLNLSPIVFICAVAMALVMLGLLKVQTRWPTFGFKSEEKHDYSDLGSPQEKQDALTDLCSICMERLDQKPLNGPTTPLLDATSASSEILRTPCKHYYHDSCLHEWVKKKLECPNCRQAIPLLVEEDE